MEYRVVTAADQSAAFPLWYEVFGDGPGFFERYFVDPWYREGDCFGAWDGDRLVSAVHVCRRPLEWEGETLWCAAIANVATFPEYRCQGHSRRLLRMAIKLMERDRLDFSMLFTRNFGHYSALGWEQVPNSTLTLHLRREEEAVFSTDIPEMVRKDWAALTDLWLNTQRPLNLLRTPDYSAGWCGFEWRKRGGRVFVLAERGYAVLSEPKSDGEALIVQEWAADSVETEIRLMRHAASLARAVGRSKVRLTKLALSPSEALAEVGHVEAGNSDYMMLRNVAMEQERYRALVQAYASGTANWWPSDDF